MYYYAVFVYGSLMEPNWRHDQYFSDFQSKGWGYIPGKLVLRQTGTPILLPEQESIIAHGTADLQADCKTQHHKSGLENWIAASETLSLSTDSHVPGTGYVKGQWIILKDTTSERFQSLDNLEEFFPSSKKQDLYSRYLIKSPLLNIPLWVYGVPENGSEVDYIPAFNASFWEMKAEGIPRDFSNGEWTGDADSWIKDHR